jgi:hypothetical protein
MPRCPLAPQPRCCPLSSATKLKGELLELTLEGEASYDIFVRWKPLAEQPIGWKPKRNFMWDKNCGKGVESALWFKRKGDWINDHHLTLAERRAARVANGKGA